MCFFWLMVVMAIIVADSDEEILRSLFWNSAMRRLIPGALIVGLITGCILE